MKDGLPSLEEAASLLVAASVIEVETDRGHRLELWTISYEGAAVSASGPRFAVVLACSFATKPEPIPAYCLSMR